MRNSRTILAVSVAALFMAAPTPAPAYVLEGQKWSQPRTNYTSIIPGRSTAFTNAMKQAMAAWSRATTFRYVPLNRSSNPCNKSGVNGAGFALKACGQAFGSTTLAVTISYYDGANRYVHAGTVFNAHKSFSVYTGPLRPSSTDFRRVAVHELGHALGLAHETKAGVKSIMAPFVSDIERPQPDDIAGVKKLYP